MRDSFGESDIGAVRREAGKFNPRIMAAGIFCRNRAVAINNAYQRKNIAGYSYDPMYAKQTPVYAFILPLSFVMQGELSINRS